MFSTVPRNLIAKTPVYLFVDNNAAVRIALSEQSAIILRTQMMNQIMKKTGKVTAFLGLAVYFCALPTLAQARTGEEVYQTKCSVCHATGAAGAPKFGDAAAWGTRIEKGSDALYASALKGVNAMPPKGMCMDCTNDEIKAAVDYMTKAK